MKKIGTCILSILLILAIVVGVFILGANMKSFNFDNKEYTIKSNTQITNSNEETAIKSDNKNNETENKKDDYYPLKILGVSNKLSQSQNDSMNNWRKRIVEISKSNSESVYIDGRTDEKLVALTFDDGPDAKVTPQVLKVLKENNIKASFFFIGERVKVYPSVVKQTFDDGNLVLSHSYTHPQFTKLAESEIKQEIISTENEISKVINKKPAIIRPPYGDTNDLVISMCNAMQYKIVIWSIDTMDWAVDSEDNIVKNVVDNIRTGDIILMHSNEDKTKDVKALSTIITQLKEKGYRFETLDEMLKIKAYKD